MHTELGRSQVQVQRCTLSWEVGKELGEETWQRAWRRVGKAEVQVEVDADKAGLCMEALAQGNLIL